MLFIREGFLEKFLIPSLRLKLSVFIPSSSAQTYGITVVGPPEGGFGVSGSVPTGYTDDMGMDDTEVVLQLSGTGARHVDEHAF